MQVNMVIWIFTLAFLAWVMWYLCFKPYNLKQDFTTYGYDQVKKNSKKRKHLINLMLRRRKLGNLPPPFPNSWYAVIESDKLVARQVAEIYICGQNLVAWRGELSEQAYVSDAYCPHLGANLAIGGTVRGDCIECPFHKWSFDGVTGNVVDVPYSKQQVCNKKLPGIKLWRVIEANGFIWVWYHEKDAEPIWFPEKLKQIESSAWKYRGRSEFEVTCHIQEIPENGADVAHLEAIHEIPGVLLKPFEKINAFLSAFVRHKWTAKWSIKQDPKYKHESTVEISHCISLFQDKIKCFNVHVNVRQIGAGMVLLNFDTPFGQGVLVQSVTPVEPLLQKITHRFYSEPKFIQPLSLIVLHSEAVQIARDVEIWNRKCFLSSPNLVKEDSNIKSFRRWFSQFYSTMEITSQREY